MPNLLSLATQSRQIDEEIRQDVIEIRRVLSDLGYRSTKLFKQARNGLLFCAAYALSEVSPDQEQVVGYLRVSMYMQSDGHSLATQARKIIAMAQERNQVVSCFYLDAGVSGADSKRPAFQAMMRQTTRGADRRYRAVYCYDLYRFYRGLTGLANNYHLLYEHGVELGSVAEKNTDLSQRDGKLLVYFKGIIGGMYLDDLSRTVTDNKFSRARKGYTNASCPPFGYCRGNCFQCTDNNGAGYCPRFGSRNDLWREMGDDPKVFVPHPIEQHGFRAASNLHIMGHYSDTDIARRLNPPSRSEELAHLTQAPHTVLAALDDGAALVQLQDETIVLQRPDGDLLFFRPKGRIGRPNPNRRFTKDTVRDVLQNPFHAGFVVYRQQKKQNGVRKQVRKRFKSPLSEANRRRRDDIPLEGEHGMLFPGLHIPIISIGQYEQSQRVRGLRGYNPSNADRIRRIYPLSGVLKCARCGEPFRGNAGNGAVRYYEDAGRVKGISDCPIRSFRADGGIEDTVSAHVEQLQIPEAWYADTLARLQQGTEWNEVRRERIAVQTQLSAIREMRKQKTLSQGEYRDLDRDYRRRLEKLERDALVENEYHLELLRDFSRLWAAATVEERKGLLRSIFSVIWVEDGVITAYEPREPFAALFPDHVSGAIVGDVHQVEQVTDRLA